MPSDDSGVSVPSAGSSGVIEREQAATPEAFDRMAPAWDRALAGYPARSVFLHSEWIRLWWRADPGLAGARMVMALRQDGTPAALAPLIADRLRKGPLAAAVWRSFGNAVATRSDLALLPGAEDRVAAVLARVFEGAPSLRRIGRIPTTAPVLARLGTVEAATGWAFRPSRRYDLPVLDTVAPHDAYLAERSRNFRKSRARMLRRHEGFVRRVIDFTTEEAGAVADAVLAVSARTWKAEAGTAIASDPAHAAFVRALLRHRGAVRPYAVLTFAPAPEGVRPVGFLVGAIWDRCLYALKTGYDPEAADIEPGFGLLDATVAHACADPGIDVVDLDAAGPHGDYKMRWMSRAETLVTGYIFGPSFSDRILRAAFGGLDRLRRSTVGADGRTDRDNAG